MEWWWNNTKFKNDLENEDKNISIEEIFFLIKEVESLKNQQYKYNQYYNIHKKF